MKKSTLRFIIVLVSMLFLNIEAAQAGLIQRFRVFILHEFPNNEWLYLVAALFVVAFLLYVILTPVAIGKEKWAWLNYPDYGTRKQSVGRINSILREGEKQQATHN